MADIAAKRKQFMKTVLDTMQLLDPSGNNVDLYKRKFEKMTDEQFDKWMKAFRDDDKSNFYLEIIEFERELDLKNIEKAADYLKIPLYEYVCVPYINEVNVNNPDKSKDPNAEIIVTPTKCPVGYLHIKRMPQSVHHKNSTTTSNSKRNTKTGQVTGDDKNGRTTDVETFALTVYGAEDSLKELMGFRADDQAAKQQAYAEIERDGYVQLSDLKSSQQDKTAINTLNAYYWAQGFATNIVNGGYMLTTPTPPEWKIKNDI